jgi:hypothetical protein
VPYPVDYRDSGVRHTRDAGLLMDKSRYDGASHFSGLAVECCLKAIVQSSLTPNPSGGGAPSIMGQQAGHLPTLWNLVMTNLRAQNRPSAAVASLVNRNQNPFLDWDIENRYAKSNSINKATAQRHYKVASEIANAL